MSKEKSPDISDVYLLDNHAGAIVEAELWDAITEKNLADWEADWIPHLFVLLKSLKQKGVERRLWPQSRHWHWSDKVKAIEGKLSNQCFSIVCDGNTQAMMTTDLVRRAQLDVQKNSHLVYVDFLEVAPWNRGELIGCPPKYSGAGSILIRAAIELSKQEGFRGRIGLHSLPQANDFYANKVGMTDLGLDENYQNLRYFEMTVEQAEEYVMKGEDS
ncbi:MAG: hypothetical protein QM500_05325 [Methylococcales bacterium]